MLYIVKSNSCEMRASVLMFYRFSEKENLILCVKDGLSDFLRRRFAVGNIIPILDSLLLTTWICIDDL